MFYRKQSYFVEHVSQKCWHDSSQRTARSKLPEQLAQGWWPEIDWTAGAWTDKAARTQRVSVKNNILEKVLLLLTGWQEIHTRQWQESCPELSNPKRAQPVDHSYVKVSYSVTVQTERLPLRDASRFKCKTFLAKVKNRKTLTSTNKKVFS